MARTRVLEQRTVYTGRVIRLVREVLDVKGQRLVRETVQHPGAVVIVPLLDRTHLLFVRQYRRAIRRRLLELPAGTLAPGERPDRCARRELEEETGWRARTLRRLGRFYAAPGFISEQLTIFLGEQLEKGTAHPDPDEAITPVVLSFAEAVARIRSGAICDAKTIIGVLFAERHLGW